MAATNSMFWKVVLFSLAAVPVSISANKLLKFVVRVGLPSAVILLIGISVLVTYVAIAYRLFQNDVNKKKIKDPFFYCFALFSFTSIVDLGIGLELDGFISDFLTEYLASGEPYLTCVYGAVICYWDGFGMYSMYLYMMYRIINNQSYRSMALYWSGNLLNSMILLILSIFVGKHGVFPATGLNVPYLVLPTIVGFHFLQNRPQIKTKASSKKVSERPLDLVFIAFLIFAIVVAVVRAVTVLDHNLWLSKFYLNEIEPFLKLNDPCPFPKMQMLLYLFYMVPVYLMSIHGLITPGCSWMVDLTLIHAGQASQAQIAHIGTTLHPGTLDEFKLPKSLMAQAVFWIVNLSLLVMPHLLLIRCLKCDAFFSTNTSSAPKNKVNNNKANKKIK